MFNCTRTRHIFLLYVRFFRKRFELSVYAVGNTDAVVYAVYAIFSNPNRHRTTT